MVQSSGVNGCAIQQRENTRNTRLKDKIALLPAKEMEKVDEILSIQLSHIY
ncbi:MAG: hypothetical protein K0R66_103 [Gammaproteobacteria bacterium]|jgi:hypothetical protein|nr:hypothetical protein [Gammaproteobacteria bacterium]